MKMKKRILLAVVILAIIVPLSGCESKFKECATRTMNYRCNNIYAPGIVTYEIDPRIDNLTITVHEDRTYDELIEDLREDEDALKQFLLDRDSWARECEYITDYLVYRGFSEYSFTVDIFIRTADDQVIFHVWGDVGISKDLVQDMIDAGELK